MLQSSPLVVTSYLYPFWDAVQVYFYIFFALFYRFLLAQLSVNLKPLWENSFKVIETYGADGDMEGFWSVWLEMFKDMNVKAASTPDQGIDKKPLIDHTT